MDKKNNKPETLSDEALETVRGGVTTHGSMQLGSLIFDMVEPSSANTCRRYKNIRPGGTPGLDIFETGLSCKQCYWYQQAVKTLGNNEVSCLLREKGLVYCPRSD